MSTVINFIGAIRTELIFRSPADFGNYIEASTPNNANVPISRAVAILGVADRILLTPPLPAQMPPNVQITFGETEKLFSLDIPTSPAALFDSYASYLNNAHGEVAIVSVHHFSFHGAQPASLVSILTPVLSTSLQNIETAINNNANNRTLSYNPISIVNWVKRTEGGQFVIKDIITNFSVVGSSNVLLRRKVFADAVVVPSPESAVNILMKGSPGYPAPEAKLYGRIV